MTHFDEHCVSRAYQFLVKTSRILLFAGSVPADPFVSTNQQDFSQTTGYKTIISLLVTFLCLWAGPTTQAVSPSPDGCYPNSTTAEGCKALQSLTTGIGNTGIGWYSLFANSTGSFNTAVRAGSLDLNTADYNTAVGVAALLLNTTGINNTANGVGTLVFNDTAEENTATGAFAMYSNTEGEHGQWRVYALFQLVGWKISAIPLSAGAETGNGTVAKRSPTLERIIVFNIMIACRWGIDS